ncbi:MAG: arsinothricin resistance N-acetyltransferase ArsN1 family B [Betaproteobacteria bacterium]
MRHAVSVRTAVDDDASAIQSIYAPIVRETAISFEDVPPNAAEMRERIRSTVVAYPFLVSAAGDGIVGYAYAGPHRVRAAYRWSVDVSVYVASPARRHGVGRALYAALLTILEMQGFHAAFAGIALPNPGSIALHEALGFTPLGVYREVGFKRGHWHDVGWWRRPLHECATPSEPLPFFAHRGRFVAAKILTT